MGITGFLQFSLTSVSAPLPTDQPSRHSGHSHQQDWVRLMQSDLSNRVTVQGLVS